MNMIKSFFQTSVNHLEWEKNYKLEISRQIKEVFESEREFRNNTSWMESESFLFYIKEDIEEEMKKSNLVMFGICSLFLLTAYVTPHINEPQKLETSVSKEGKAVSKQ